MKTIKQIEVSGKVLNFVLLNLNVESEMNLYYNLFTDCFGIRSNVNLETFSWFNLKHPLFDNLTFAFIDSTNNKFIAAYGLLPGDVFINNKYYKYCLCTNVMTHPDYAGQGLFKLIGRESLDYAKNLGFWFCFGVPNDQAIKGHLGVGWEKVNEIKFFEIKCSEITKDSFSSNVKINRLRDFDDSFYYDLFCTKYNLFFNRNAKWINWRLSKPFSDYVTLSISTISSSAYIVLKKYSDSKVNLKKLHIVDFGYTDEQVFNELMFHTQYYAKKGNFDLINVWQYSFNTTEFEMLSFLDFKETNVVNPLIIHKLGNNIDFPTSNWHLTLFDNDVY